MHIKLTWYLKDDRGGDSEKDTLLKGAGPFQVGRLATNDVPLPHASVSRTHATLTVEPGRIVVADTGSQNGIFIDGRRVTNETWNPGQLLQIGPYVLEYDLEVDRAANRAAAAAPGDATVFIPQQNVAPRAPQVQAPARDAPRAANPAQNSTGFPGKLFDQAIVPIASIQETGRFAGEYDYLAIGGGMGSFVWVDHLRCYGVPAASIRVIGVAGDKKPYAKYQRLCTNSQIPPDERIRSNSISAPDNIWGFPGYASRETWRELKRGNVGGLNFVFQVFGEPATAISYVPKSKDVFTSLDVEGRRIGWNDMWVTGRVVGIRKTDDERFVIAYRLSQRSGANEQNRDRFIIARFVHLATGYPASNYLPDLQAFRQANDDSHLVVNAYEEHEDVYAALEKEGGTVLIRGRGIVASRVIQRVWEARKRNPSIQVVHLSRSPVTEGKKYELARREVKFDVERQPFNWPKACWGGALRKKLEQATPEERARLLATWGGTTTAPNALWDQILSEGLKAGWYRVAYGKVKGMSQSGKEVVTEIESAGASKETLRLKAHFVVDCTGLIASLDESPLFRDLFQVYALPRNRVSGEGAEARLSGLAVSNSFEVESLRNGRGRVYACGVLVANGPYAAVDSFLGLQYSALRSVDQLGAVRAPNVSRFGPLKSMSQWFKWCAGRAP